MLGAAAIATALVGAGYHYATDTVGGLCLAVAVVPSVAFGIDLVPRRGGPAGSTRPGSAFRALRCRT